MSLKLLFFLNIVRLKYEIKYSFTFFILFLHYKLRGRNKIEIPFRKLGAISGKNVQKEKNPLHVYAEDGNDEIFLVIITIPYYEQYINQEDNFGNTPLDYAYRSNNEGIITALIEKGAKAKSTLKRRLWFQKVGIAIGIVGILTLLYQSNKKYGWFSSLQQYMRSKKQ